MVYAEVVIYLVGLIAVHTRVGATHFDIVIFNLLAFTHCDCSVKIWSIRGVLVCWNRSFWASWAADKSCSALAKPFPYILSRGGGGEAKYILSNI